MERYERLKVLGVGSFGKVYLMRHRQERRLVCAKIIKIKNIPRKEREACRTEVDLMRRLHHPNIVGYRDSFLTPRKDHLCIVMEYCDGGDLSTQITNARKRLFPESKILHWFVQIALGLHYMHARLVLHRDIKTQNIFLLGNGRLVLGDLGISKVLEGTTDLASTRIGTPYYMSPELFKNTPYNHKSDVWALGCVLYEMTALTHAFDATSLHGLASRVAKGRYASIHSKYSRNLRNLISQMLSTSAAERPDLDQILRMGFIKKHIHNFLADVVSRETHKIGEGTMVLKAAAVNLLADDKRDPSNLHRPDGGIGLAGPGSNEEMLSLKKQMEELGLHEEVKKAVNPPEAMKPTDASAAAKVVKEQTGALRREEDRRKAVQSALARLRKEREERLRARHGRDSHNLPPPPPPPGVLAAAEARPNVDKGGAGVGVGGGWQAGVVGVGVGVGAGVWGSSSEAGGPKKGGGPGPGVPPQPEGGAVRRLSSLLGLDERHARAREGGVVPPRAPSQAIAAPRRREGRRSLGPRESRHGSGSRKSSRPQERRRSFGGGTPRSSLEVDGVRPRRKGVDVEKPRDAVHQAEIARVRALDKFGRAREAEQRAADAMAKRAASKESASKREDTLQRDRDRLRLDKVELDRRMQAREQQRRQRVMAMKSKAGEERAQQHEHHSEDQTETTGESPDVASEGSKPAAAALVPAVSESAVAVVTAEDLSIIPPSVPRTRARNMFGQEPASRLRLQVQPSISAIPTREVLRQRRREKAMLEDVVRRKEMAVVQERALLPPPPPPRLSTAAKKTVGHDNTTQAVGVYGRQNTNHEADPRTPGSHVEERISAHDSSPDTGERLNDSFHRGQQRKVHGVGDVCIADNSQSVERKGAGDREVSGSSDSEAMSTTDEVRTLGIDANDDDADEDIHAREELLEAELQVSTMRCEELRHNLQETKSMIPAVALTVVSNGRDASGSTDCEGIRSGAQPSAGPPQDSTHEETPSIDRRIRGASAGSEEDGTQSTEDEGGDEDEHEGGRQAVQLEDGKESDRGKHDAGGAVAGRGSFRRDSGETTTTRREKPSTTRTDDRVRVYDVAGLETTSSRNVDTHGGQVEGIRWWENANGSADTPSLEMLAEVRGPRPQAQNFDIKSERSLRDSDSREGFPIPFHPQNFAGTAHGSGENGAEAQPKMGIPPSPPPLAPGSTNDRRSAGVARERKSTSRRTAPDISSELDARVTLRQDNADAVAIQLTSRESSPSPPPSAPTGRLADRIRSLRERCRLGLGAETFERAYRYLKAQEEADSSCSEESILTHDDREERLVRGLTDILGRNKVHYYSIIDQLIFVENTHTGPG